MRHTRGLGIGAAVGLAAMLGLPAMAGAASGKPTITIGSTNFPEQTIVANAYGDVLAHAGYPVTVKANLGTRAAVEPALAHGQLSIEPDYAGSLLNFLNGQKPTAAANTLTTAVPALKAKLSSAGVTVLTPAPAVDANVFVVTRATAQKYHLSTLTSLKSAAPKLVLGGPPECPTFAGCEPGLKKVYGLQFQSFKALDESGPISVAALKQGQVGVVELFSSDPAVLQNGFVVLQDNKHLQPADHVIPVIRKSVANAQVTKLLNGVSAKLTTSQLAGLNLKVSNQHESAATVAKAWVQSQHLT